MPEHPDSFGRSFAFGKDNVDIAVVDLNEEKMNAVAAEVKALGRNATIFKADVSKRDDVYAAVEHAEKELGGFDIIGTTPGSRRSSPLGSRAEGLR